MHLAKTDVHPFVPLQSWNASEFCQNVGVFDNIISIMITHVFNILQFSSRCLLMSMLRSQIFSDFSDVIVSFVCSQLRRTLQFAFLMSRLPFKYLQISQWLCGELFDFLFHFRLNFRFNFHRRPLPLFKKMLGSSPCPLTPRHLWAARITAPRTHNSQNTPFRAYSLDSMMKQTFHMCSKRLAGSATKSSRPY